MEEPDQLNGTEETPSYWESIGIAALIFAIITWAIGLIMGYATINGSTGVMSSLISKVVICLIGAFAGMVAVWHYANTYDITMKLGKGALIGFLSGVGIVIISIILSKIWMFIDPDYYQKIMQATIERLKEMNVPEEQVSAMAKSDSTPSIGRQLLIGIPVFGLLNLATGMIGVALFAKEEDDY